MLCTPGPENLDHGLETSPESVCAGTIPGDADPGGSGLTGVGVGLAIATTDGIKLCCAYLGSGPALAPAPAPARRPETEFAAPTITVLDTSFRLRSNPSHPNRCGAAMTDTLMNQKTLGIECFLNRTPDARQHKSLPVEADLTHIAEGQDRWRPVQLAGEVHYQAPVGPDLIDQLAFELARELGFGSRTFWVVRVW